MFFHTTFTCILLMSLIFPALVLPYYLMWCKVNIGTYDRTHVYAAKGYCPFLGLLAEGQLLMSVLAESDIDTIIIQDSHWNAWNSMIIVFWLCILVHMTMGGAHRKTTHCIPTPMFLRYQQTSACLYPNSANVFEIPIHAFKQSDCRILPTWVYM